MRRCILAILNSGNDSDDARALLEKYKDFSVGFLQQDRGLKVSLRGAPGTAFVDGKMIRGIRELLFAVLRDLVFTRNEIQDSGRFDLDESNGITDAVFHIVRNAGLLQLPAHVNLAVCWGGHAINREEYEYSKQVGYELGLRGLNVCTGCGPGAMKGPMKGATIGHAKQRIKDGRYVGITEPGIIAAESPNPIVNSLVIMPDIEKRLEAFVRVGHGVIVFPGGVGTAEEILFLLGVLLHPDNGDEPMPMIMTGPASAEPYFRQIDAFITATLGETARKRYSIVIDDARKAAQIVGEGLNDVREFREQQGNAYFFNWRLVVDENFQRPFTATHQAMSALNIHENLPGHELAANLRRAFSGIVSGNVREETVVEIENHGPFDINGSARIMRLLDQLLAAFAAQKRMKIAGANYVPCYRIR